MFLRLPCGASPYFLSLFVLTLAQAGCLFFHGQRYQHFSTSRPLPEGHCLVLGFLGGREPWDSARSSVRKLALELRSMNLPGVHAETVENRKRKLALRLIQEAFDRDSDGVLEEAERARVRLILYGQSFGGAAVIKLARQLQQLQVPVLLTVQIDSVGMGDEIVPANVRAAANLFQDEGWIIRGEERMRPENPQKTRIIGNFEFDYGDVDIDLSGVPWFKKIFRVAHTKMNYDARVWTQVKALILEHALAAQ